MQSTQMKYLLAISMACGTDKRARVVDIADRLGYSKASVTRTVDALVFLGYCVRNLDKTISLTQKGQSAVCDCNVLTDVIAKLLAQHFDLPLRITQREALQVAYALSPSTRQKIIDLVKSGV